ncbi:helix-turn-helix domain-containing protein [uncultured Aureimonas sp.]|uniref:helix-turn-helix domain-containing protein n=1 Tax=uncultured Aureimonas sp. TaxID=1604662 RepID=UPI0025E5B35A|nr:helix-turn-helix domain-containing protein [uncultured Aureimonas sp.]
MFAPNIEIMPPTDVAAHVWTADKENSLPLDGWLRLDGAARALIVGRYGMGTSTSPAPLPDGIVLVSYTSSRGLPVSPGHVARTADSAGENAVAVAEPAFGEIGEIRTLSGLTFDQLATVMGVQRRSIHNWMAGGNVRPSHRERLGRVLAVLRHVDRGSARENANLLLAPVAAGATGLDMLRDGRFEELAQAAGKGAGRSEPLRIDRSRTPLRGEEPGGWLEAVVRASSSEPAGDATLVRGRETRRVPFPKR